MSILFVDYARQYEIDTFYEVCMFCSNVSCIFIVFSIMTFTCCRRVSATEITIEDILKPIIPWPIS